MTIRSARRADANAAMFAITGDKIQGEYWRRVAAERWLELYKVERTSEVEVDYSSDGDDPYHAWSKIMNVVMTNAVIKCVHCGRTTLATLQVRPMKSVTPLDHGNRCIMKSPFQKRQATYNVVPGSPMFQWEDGNEYAYLEYGKHRPDRS